MRRILLGSLLLNGFFVVAFLWREAPVHAGGGTKPVGNGDVNGDGLIDISDAIYLLSSLFTGGPEPMVIDCQAAGGKGLPATGQTKCYNFGGGEMDCALPESHGMDGYYQEGCPAEGRFVANGDGTVTDNCTGLMWQISIGDEDRRSWGNALKYCEDLDSAGHTDWRLPNVRELESIVDYGRLSQADPVVAIDPIFGVVKAGGYWTSTVYAYGDPGGPFMVLFGSIEVDGGFYGVPGEVSLGSSKGDGYVRAVRNAP